MFTGPPLSVFRPWPRSGRLKGRIGQGEGVGTAEVVLWFHFRRVSKLSTSRRSLGRDRGRGVGLFRARQIVACLFGWLETRQPGDSSGGFRPLLVGEIVRGGLLRDQDSERGIIGDCFYRILKLEAGLVMGGQTNGIVLDIVML